MMTSRKNSEKSNLNSNSEPGSGKKTRQASPTLMFLSKPFQKSHQKVHAQSSSSTKYKNDIPNGNTEQKKVDGKVEGSKETSRFVIPLHNGWKKRWDSTVVVLGYWNFWVILLRWSFLPERATGVIDVWDVLHYLIDLIFWMDFVFGFYTAYGDEYGNEVTDKKLIVKRYLKKHFRVDLIGNLPFEVIAFVAKNTGTPWREGWLMIRTEDEFWYQIEMFLKLNRLLRISRLIRKMDKQDVTTNNQKMANLLLYFVSVAHLVACCFFFIGRGFSGNEFTGKKPWIDEFDVNNTDFFTRYVNSLYFAFTTMTTVGYGDITPGTNTERMFACLTMLSGAVVYAIIFGEVQLLLKRFDAANLRYIDRKESVEEFIRFSELPASLRQRIRTYTEYNWKTHRGFELQEVMNGLPSNIQEEVSLHLHKRLLTNCAIFDGCERGFLKLVATKLKPQVCLPGENICEAGDTEQDIYFISKGRVQVLSSDGQLVYAVLTAGDFFGEMALIDAGKRNAVVKALIYTDLFFLSRDDMDEVLCRYPEYRKRIRKVATQRQKQNKRKIDKARKIAGKKGDGEELDAEALEEARSDELQQQYLDFKKKQLARQRGEVIEEDTDAEDKVKDQNDALLGMKTPTKAGRAVLPPLEGKPTLPVENTTIEQPKTPVAKEEKNTPEKETPEKKTPEKGRKTDSFLKKLTEAKKKDGKKDKEEEDHFRRFFSMKDVVSHVIMVQRFRKWRVIMQDDPRKRKWDWFIIYLVMYNMFTIPFHLAFYPMDVGNCVKYQQDEARWLETYPVIDVIIDMCFWIDFILCFRTSFETKAGVNVRNPRDIARHYLKHWFAVDLISNLPIFDIATNIVKWSGAVLNCNELRLLNLLRLNGMFRFARVLKQLDRLAAANSSRIVKLLAFFCLVSHCMGCLFYFIGAIEKSSSATGLYKNAEWTDSVGVHDANMRTKYATCLYWAFTTMTTVGYGDITPSSNAEKVAVCIIMMVGCVMYASIFGNVSLILQSYAAAESRFRDKNDLVNEFAEFNDLPLKMVQRMRSYYRTIWARNKGVDVQGVMRRLPPTLRNEINLMLHHELVTSCAFFAGCEDGFIKAVASRLNSQLCLPGEYVVEEGDSNEELYFIKRGRLRVENSLGTTVYGYLEAGEIFGEMALIEQTKRTASIKAMTSVDLYYLTRPDFMDIMLNFPEYISRIESVAADRMQKMKSTKIRQATSGKNEAQVKNHISSSFRLSLLAHAKTVGNVHSSGGEGPPSLGGIKEHDEKPSEKSSKSSKVIDSKTIRDVARRYRATRMKSVINGRYTSGTMIE